MKIKGFTPFIDMVYQHYLETGQSQQEAMITTLVFGSVYRHSNMRKRYCDASRDTIAVSIGVSRKTVNRRLPVLCEDGFLEDLTPGVKNKPHIYIPTEKAEILVTMQVGQGVPVGGTGSPSRWDRESLEETKSKPEETNLCAPENSDDFDDIFPPEFVAQQQERFSREPKTKVDPASPLYAAAKQNEQLGQNPKDHPAFAAFRGVRPDYETPALLDNLTICQNDCGFEGDQAWLAAAFLTYTGLPTSKLTGDGKIARDARAKWRREMEVYLKDDPLIKVLSYYHYAVTEMHEDGLSIHDPGSISNRVADIIARSNRANGGKEYVPRQRNV